VFVADLTTQSTDKNVREPIPAGQLQSSYEPSAGSGVLISSASSREVSSKYICWLAQRYTTLWPPYPLYVGHSRLRPTIRL
jgi:hypothetical protein